MVYEQDHHDWLPLVFGCEHDGPCVQSMGGVDTCEGRLLNFSSVLQHRVGPFKLIDPTKPGDRMIVAMFLVDPNIKVISTAHVPCQRMDWWTETLAPKQAGWTIAPASCSFLSSSKSMTFLSVWRTQAGVGEGTTAILGQP